MSLDQLSTSWPLFVLGVAVAPWVWIVAMDAVDYVSGHSGMSGKDQR